MAKRVSVDQYSSNFIFIYLFKKDEKKTATV